MIKIIILTFCLFLFSCVEKKVGSFAEVKTQGITTLEEEFIIIGGNDRGEFTTGGENVFILGEFTNRSKFAYTDITMSISEFPMALLKFAPDGEGKNLFPGFGGTCSRVLQPGKSCIIKMVFNPSSTGELTQTIFIKYKDLVNEQTFSVDLDFFMGEAPFIVETNAERAHDFGTIERTIPENIYKKSITLKNIGGLTARNLEIALSNEDQNAYRIVEAEFPTDLLAGEEFTIDVELRSPNSAPEDQNDYFYSKLTVIYNKSSANATKPELGKFGFDYSTFSTKIEGILDIHGIKGIILPEIIHGNYETTQFKVKNTGTRELILRRLVVYDNSPLSNLVAICSIENGTQKFNCYDPVQTHQTKMLKAANDEDDFPFIFNDKDNCFYNFSNGAYSTSNDAKAGPYIVGITVDDIQGRICEVGVTFHSSIKNTKNRNFSGWSIGFEYDTTYLDQQVNTTTNSMSDGSVSFIDVKSIKSGVLELERYSINGNATGGINQSAPFIYDIGRITAIQPTSTYYDSIFFRFKNNSAKAPIKVISITTDNNEGETFYLKNTPQVLNRYYTNLRLAAGCEFSAPIISQQCDVLFNFSPKLDESTQGVSDLDNYGSIPANKGNKVRHFELVYSDGCSYEDDGVTPCQNKLIKFDFKSDIVQRGSLEFGGPKQVGKSGQIKNQYDSGAIKRTVAGNLMNGQRGWQHLWLTNIGSGPIPYINLFAGTALDRRDLYAGVAGGVFPFRIIPNTDGLESGIEYDCAEFLRGDPVLDTRSPIIGTDPDLNNPLNKKLPAGRSCRLTIESMVYPNELAAITASAKWSINLREPINVASFSRFISFEYYDGDLTKPEETKVPGVFLEGFGDKKRIVGGSSGDWELRTGFEFPGKLIPITPSPVIGAIIYRPEKNYPAVAKHDHSQYVAFAGEVIPPQIYNISSLLGTANSYNHSSPGVISYPSSTTTALPAIGTREAFAYLDSTKLDFNDEASDVDYVYYAGAFPETTNEDLVFSFMLDNRTVAGSLAPVHIISESTSCISTPLDCSGSNPKINRGTIPLPIFPVSVFSGNSSRFVDFSLKLSKTLENIGRYESLITIEMKTPFAETLKIKVIVDVVPPTTSGTSDVAFSVVAQDFSCLKETGTICTDEDGKVPMGSSVDITDQFFYTKAPLSTFTMSGVVSSPFIMQKELTITNTGAQPIYDLKVFLKDSLPSNLLYYTLPQGIYLSPIPSAYSTNYLAKEYQCGEVLAKSASCKVILSYKPQGSAVLNRFIGISHKLLGPVGTKNRTGVYVSRFMRGDFEGNNQANLVVYKHEKNYRPLRFAGNPVNSYPIRFQPYSHSNHLVLPNDPAVPLTSDGRTTIVLELFNQQTERASLLRSYENINCPVTRNCSPSSSTTWTTFYNQDQKELLGTKGCFFGVDTDANKSNRSGFNASTVGSAPCKVRLNYKADLSKTGVINPQDTIMEIEYYSAQRLTTKKLYLHLEGFIEPYRSIANQNKFEDVYANSDGEVALEWVPFNNEVIEDPLSFIGSIKNYRVYYSKIATDMQKIYDIPKPSSLLFKDTLGTATSVELTGLTNSTIYYFSVVAIREGRTFSGASIDYLSVAPDFVRQKIIVPPHGFAFDYIGKNLIQRSISEDSISKAQASSECSRIYAIIQDTSGKHTKSLGLLTAKVYEEVIQTDMFGDYSDHDYESVSTWLNEVVNLNNIPELAYECNVPSDVGLESSVGYIKLCDSGDPNAYNACCKVHILDQMRGMPFAAKENIKMFLTNIDNYRSNYRCFANFTNELK